MEVIVDHYKSKTYHLEKFTPVPSMNKELLKKLDNFETKISRLEPLFKLVEDMENIKEPDIISFFSTLASEKSSLFEKKISNRIDNLVDTLAYKHEVKAMEDAINLLKIRVDGSDYIQKDNDKKYYEMMGTLKK